MPTLDAVLLQLLDDQPQRPLGLWGILTGRKTASIMFAGLEHSQLQYFGLLPDLTKPEYLAAVRRLQQDRLLNQAEQKVWRSAAGRARCADMAALQNALKAYAPSFGVTQFDPRFFLAVQVVSEASYQQRRYAPISADWQVQQYVRRWYRTVFSALNGAISELHALFSQLDPQVADYLAALMVGHDYVGSGVSQDSYLYRELALSALLRVLEERPASAWTQLWGGRVDLIPAAAAQTCAEFVQGATVAQLVKKKNRRLSTITEHLQIAAILGTPLPLDRFLSAEQQATLEAAWAQGQRSYQDLLAALPGAEFLQVRMFQIEKYRGYDNAR